MRYRIYGWLRRDNRTEGSVTCQPARKKPSRRRTESARDWATRPGRPRAGQRRWPNARAVRPDAKPWQLHAAADKDRCVGACGCRVRARGGNARAPPPQTAFTPARRGATRPGHTAPSPVHPGGIARPGSRDAGAGLSWRQAKADRGTRPRLTWRRAWPNGGRTTATMDAP